MQYNLISIENMFLKNSALCCIARSRLSAMLHSRESWLHAMYSIAHIRKYLREIETEFENILWCYSGAQGQSIYEKTRGWKARETVSLSCAMLLLLTSVQCTSLFLIRISWSRKALDHPGFFPSIKSSRLTVQKSFLLYNAFCPDSWHS
jgi:hypothetical protein